MYSKPVSVYITMLILISLFIQCNKQERLDYNTFCFYYNWYGNSDHNGEDIHWAHPVFKAGDNDTVTEGYLPGGTNISSNFFPQLGTYSCTDSATIFCHMEMLKEARIGVIILTWWDIHDFGYQSIDLIMDEAAKANIEVCFHIEPFPGRNASTIRSGIENIIDTYGNHPAFYRMGDRPLFFVYDSYLISVEEWAKILKPESETTIRKTPYDAVMIGLWVNEGEEDFFIKSGFDGFYTYFGATGFTYGSTPQNWDYLQKWATAHNKIFIPCVAPGYIDTRIRPWNNKTTRDRENGVYYDNMFQAVIDSKARFVGITSFNEWHEGTQIEPAVPFNHRDFHYLDYGPFTPDYYLKRTSYWIDKLKKNKDRN